MTGRRWLYMMVVLAALLFRGWGLGAQSLWIDEGETWFFVQQDDLLATLAHYDSAPPLAYITIKAVLAVAGVTETTLRLAPALCGFLGVLVTGAAVPASRPGARLAAIIIAALHPVLYWHSQDARSYSLLFLASAAMLYFTLALADPAAPPAWRRRRFAGFLGWSVAGFYTHYFALFLFAGCLLYLCWDRRLSRRALLQAMVAYCGCILPLALLFRAQAATLGYITMRDVMTASAWERAVTGARALYYLAFGYTTFSLQHAPELARAGLPLALAALLCLVLQTRGAGAAAWRQFVCFIAVPVGIPLLAQLLGLTFVMPRYLIPALPGCIVLVAVFARPGRATLVAAAVLVAVFAMSAWNFRCDPRYQKEDWRGLAALLQARQQQGEAVAFYGAVPRVYRYYLAGAPAPPQLAPNPESFVRQVHELAGADGRTVWVVFYHGCRAELPDRLARLAAQGGQAGREVFSRMLLLRFDP